VGLKRVPGEGLDAPSREIPSLCSHAAHWQGRHKSFTAVFPHWEHFVIVGSSPLIIVFGWRVFKVVGIHPAL
jgi:hypothetical protein